MNIFIGIPHIGNLRTELVLFLMKLKNQKIYFSHRMPIDDNRNHIVDEFLKTDSSHLLMIDSDIQPCDNILEMVSNDVDICCGAICTNKGGEVIPLAMMKVDGGYKCKRVLNNGINEVDAIGTGCIMIKREVLEKMSQPYFQFKYKDGKLVNGEDFDFCYKAKELGFKVYYDASYKCNHFQTYPLCIGN